MGWYTHTVALIQVSPAFVPMQYNTALGFLLSGTGLVSFISGVLPAVLAVQPPDSFSRHVRQPWAP